MSVKADVWKHFFIAIGQCILVAIAAWIISFGITMMTTRAGWIGGRDHALIVFGLSWIIAVGMILRRLIRR